MNEPSSNKPASALGTGHSLDLNLFSPTFLAESPLAQALRERWQFVSGAARACVFVLVASLSAAGPLFARALTAPTTTSTATVLAPRDHTLIDEIQRAGDFRAIDFGGVVPISAIELELGEQPRFAARELKLDVGRGGGWHAKAWLEGRTRPDAQLPPASQLMLLDPPVLTLERLRALTEQPTERDYATLDEATEAVRRANPGWSEGDVRAKAQALTEFSPQLVLAVLLQNGAW